MLNQDATFQDVNETLSAQYSMLDSMGIYQHHDAVTGTAMTHVAQDYNMRLYNSMKFASNPVYAKTLQDVLLSQKTKVKSQDWQWCERLNGTYLDCPVSQNPQSNFLIAAHNPSMLNQSYFKAKVSHGNYAVKVWD